MRNRASRLPPSRQPSSFFAISMEDKASPRSSSRMLTALAGISGILPPRSGSSVTFVGHWIRLRYRSTKSASGERPIFPRATMWSSNLLGSERRSAERPGKDRLEPVVDSASRFCDRLGAIGTATCEDGNRNAPTVGKRDEPDVVRKPVKCSGLMFDRRAIRQHCLHPVLARLAPRHEVEQVITAFGLDQLGLV